MADAPDVYADQMGLNLGPVGCAVNFSVSAAVPQPSGISAGQPVATVRMSLEHLKLMTFLFRRQLIQYERASGIQISIPQETLNQLRIGREDWVECWGGGR
jgi:hypothetical protein